jgi:hypothetical protein
MVSNALSGTTLGRGRCVGGVWFGWDLGRLMRREARSCRGPGSGADGIGIDARQRAAFDVEGRSLRLERVQGDATTLRACATAP